MVMDLRKSLGRSCKEKRTVSHKNVKSVQRDKKVSQNSLLIPVELNETHKLNRCYVVLKSISFKKKSNKTNMPAKKSRLSIKSVIPQKQISHAKSIKPVIETVTPLKRTNNVHKRKYSKKSIISQIDNIPVTSTPLCINSISERKSAETSIIERNYHRKVSRTSQIIPLESTTLDSIQPGYDKILRSRKNVQASISGKLGCSKTFVTPKKQMVHKTGSETVSVTPLKQSFSCNRIENSRNSSITFQKQNFPVTSTPISLNPTSKYESIGKENRKKNVFNKEISQASPVILMQSANETASSSRCSMTLRSRHSSKATSRIQTPLVKKTKSIRKSSMPNHSSAIIEQCGVTIKEVSSEEIQKRAFKKQKSSVSSQKKLSSKCRKKTSVVAQRNTQDKFNTFSGMIPLDDLALSVGSRVRKVKSDNFKAPNKNTLKRKRELIEAVKKADEGYQDDMYDPKKFEKFMDLFDTSDSDVPSTISTPKLGFPVTPMIRHKTPKYTDCFNPAAYAVARKNAEEYIYRNKKRKSSMKPVTPVIAEKKKLEFSQILAQAEKIKKAIEGPTADSDEDDSYFSFC